MTNTNGPPLNSEGQVRMVPCWFESSWFFRPNPSKVGDVEVSELKMSHWAIYH